MQQTKELVKKIYRRIIIRKLEGIGVIEIILILVVIIGLVLIFRNQIEAIIKSAFASITGDAKGINTDMVIPTSKP